MPTLKKNTNGEYYTQYYTNGTVSTIHFNNDIKSYLQKKNLSVGDELPHSWYSDTKKWQYIHGMGTQSYVSSFLLNAKCPVCGAHVFYYENEYGSKVYFDHAGDTWPKHPCTNKDYYFSKNEILIKIEIMKLLYSKNNIIIYTNHKYKILTTPVFSIKNKSLCEFYILKKDNIPIKLIVIEESTARELDIIKYDSSNSQIDIQNHAIHTSEEKVSIAYIKYTGKNGNLMNIYLNEHNIASYIQIYKRYIDFDEDELYIIRGNKIPNLRIVSNRTAVKREVKILKFCKTYPKFCKTYPTIKNTKPFSIGDSVEVNGKTGIIEWINLRNEYCINTKYEKDIYVYRRGRFILLKDDISESQYLNAPLSPKHKKKPKKNSRCQPKRRKSCHK